MRRLRRLFDKLCPFSWYDGMGYKTVWPWYISRTVQLALVVAALWLAGRLSLVHVSTQNMGESYKGMSAQSVERWRLEWRFDYHIIHGSDDYRVD